MKYDLCIALRVCPILSRTAVGFSDKLDLVALSCRSLRLALEGVSWKMAIILDGCPPGYRSLMEEIFGGCEVSFYETPSIGNQRTYDKQVDLLLAEKEAKYVYFAEDDYIYVPEAIKAMLDWMSCKDVDFVTPLDHPGNYLAENIAIKTPLRVSHFRHWREVGSTCLTFMTTPGILRKRERTFRYFSRFGEEGTQWLAFTHDSTYDLLVLLRGLWRVITRVKCHFGFLMPLCTWRHHFSDLIFHRRKHLWCPVPSLAIHCCDVSLPPFCSAIVPETMVTQDLRERMEEVSRRFIVRGFGNES